MAKIQIKRGNYANLPTLLDGEMAFTKDTQCLYIGLTGTGNVLLGNMTKSVYDTNASGVVDNSERLNGQLATYYTDITARLGYTPVNKTGDSMSGALDIWSGNIALTVGADNNGNTRTNAADKHARVGGAHYTNAEEPVTLLYMSATSSNNTVYLGGGSGTMNAATILSFVTAANNTTLTGTERMRIDANGNVGIGTASPVFENAVSGSLHLHNANTGALTELHLTNGNSGATATDGCVIQLGSGGGMFLWNRENNNISFGTNNTQRMILDSTGRLCIGTGSPDYMLNIYGTSGTFMTKWGGTSAFGGLYANDLADFVSVGSISNDDFRIFTNGTDKMTVTATGAVGIGTTSPTAPLQVLGTGASGYPILSIAGSGSGSFVWGSATVFGNIAAGESVINLFGRALSTKNSAHIGFKYMGAGSNSNLLCLGFYDSNELVNITANGNVGIGTTSPDPIGFTAGSPVVNISSTNDSYGGVLLLTTTVLWHLLLQLMAQMKKELLK
jgi:hypothetical protein